MSRANAATTTTTAAAGTNETSTASSNPRATTSRNPAPRPDRPDARPAAYGAEPVARNSRASTHGAPA